MAALGELVSTTTHEFNNVLMTIINYAKIGMRNKDEELATRRSARFWRLRSAKKSRMACWGSLAIGARKSADRFGEVDRVIARFA